LSTLFSFLNDFKYLRDALFWHRSIIRDRENMSYLCLPFSTFTYTSPQVGQSRTRPDAQRNLGLTCAYLILPVGTHAHVAYVLTCTI